MVLPHATSSCNHHHLPIPHVGTNTLLNPLKPRTKISELLAFMLEVKKSLRTPPTPTQTPKMKFSMPNSKS